MDNDLFSSLLNDPNALQNAMKMASEALGGGGGGAAAPASSPSRDYDPSAELMEKALPVLGNIVQSGQSAVKQEKRALLNAVKPFVTDQVSTQFDHAMRLVSMARMARAALEQAGRKGEDRPDEGEKSL